jgi:hypothetical protein
MAEKITPMPVVGGGSPDVSRPNDNGIRTLASSLGVIVQSAAEIGQQAQANEFQNIQSLLNDATVGPDEAKEIAGNAYFPVNRFAAQNRAGEAKVLAERDAIEQDLLQATDSLDARQRLRVYQQKLMESENELGVQAGIRQAIADLAGPLINDASKKRLELRNIQRRNDESFILREQFTKDPKAFVPALGAILSDQEMDATQEPDVHKTAGQTLLNTLIENPASAPFVKQAAKEALASGLVEGADNRAQYTGVLKAVRVLENAANDEGSDKKVKLRERSSLGMHIIDLNAAGQGASDEAREAERLYLQTFDNPIPAASALRTLKESGRQTPVGMVDTDPYRAGFKSIESQLRTSMFLVPTAQDNEVRAATYEIYDSIMGAMDPEAVRQSGDGYAQAQQAAELAISKAKEFVATKKDEKATREANTKELSAQMFEASKAGDKVTARALYKERERLKRASVLDQRKALLNGYVNEARNLGISVLDLRP